MVKGLGFRVERKILRVWSVAELCLICSASRPPIVDARRGMPEGGAPTAMGTPVGNNVRKSSTGETFTAA